MYVAGMQAKADAAARGGATGSASEAPLGGGVQPAEEDNVSRADRVAALPSFLRTDTPASQNEAWARLNADPLLAMRKQEMERVKTVKENPVRMLEIMQEVGDVFDGGHRCTIPSLGSVQPVC